MNMTAFAQACGGVGLFLLGMTLMTGALKSLAGDALKDILAKFTGGRISAILLGTVVTTMVQSSHVTTIAAIGFVSAGLLSFRNSLGVIFGANLGTTTIGWIVSLLGFKFKIGLISLPLVAAGALLRITGSKKILHLGTVLCGFALIFIGVDFLQTGMGGLASIIHLEGFHGSTFSGRIILVGIGIVMVLIMQSSGATITMTLAALASGTISLEQGAALVIGQNIGTTITAAVAGIGATAQAKRTAVAHIMFNVFTAVIAFIILPVMIVFLKYVSQRAGIVSETIILSAFHSAFNILGVLIFTPFLDYFALAIEKMIPQTGPDLTRNLDSSVHTIPSIALESGRRTIYEILKAELFMISRILNGKPAASEVTSDELKEAILKTSSFLTKIRSRNDESEKEFNYHINLLHAIEHVDFIFQAIMERENSNMVFMDESLNNASADLKREVDQLLEWINSGHLSDYPEFVKDVSRKVKTVRKNERKEIFKKTASGQFDTERTYKMIENLRWMDKVTYRLWRSVKYLSGHNV
ncbi:MAG: Na/Pi cotransporter family protein [Spirochaetes bacterium]|nr:Na/Pi cotransporter family protein [Spirochaetota bacterium]